MIHKDAHLIRAEGWRVLGAGKWPVADKVEMGLFDCPDKPEPWVSGT
jgi:hypothetical protein